MKTAASLHSVKIITFDLDDTLCPEHQYVQSGFRAVSTFLQKQGLVEHDVFPAMWEKFVAGDRTTVFNQILEKFKINPKDNLIKTLIGVYRAHDPKITLYPDARVVLDYFFERKKLALLSDGYLQTQTAKMAALEIKHYFSAIVLTDELGRNCWKPSPVGFQHIMQVLDGDPPEYVYIGDNPKKDFAAPRQLGWHTICVRRPNGVYAAEEPHDANFAADIMVSDLYQAALLLDPGFAATK